MPKNTWLRYSVITCGILAVLLAGLALLVSYGMKASEFSTYGFVYKKFGSNGAADEYLFYNPELKTAVPVIEGDGSFRTDSGLQHWTSAEPLPLVIAKELEGPRRSTLSLWREPEWTSSQFTIDHADRRVISSPINVSRSGKKFVYCDPEGNLVEVDVVARVERTVLNAGRIACISSYSAGGFFSRDDTKYIFHYSPIEETGERRYDGLESRMLDLRTGIFETINPIFAAWFDNVFNAEKRRLIAVTPREPGMDNEMLIVELPTSDIDFVTPDLLSQSSLLDALPVRDAYQFVLTEDGSGIFHRHLDEATKEYAFSYYDIDTDTEYTSLFATSDVHRERPFIHAAYDRTHLVFSVGGTLYIGSMYGEAIPIDEAPRGFEFISFVKKK